MREVETADTVFVADGAPVRIGDTLAFRQNDPYALLRADLLALRAGQSAPKETLATFERIGGATSITDDLLAFLTDLQRRATSSDDRQTQIAVAPRVDRELLSAEVMGAEDALADLRGQLRYLSPATSPDLRQQAEIIRAAIAEKEAFLARARKQLRTPPTSSGLPRRPTAPELTDAQRARIDNYAAGLAPDTAYVLAPATGIFRMSSERATARIELRDALARNGGERAGSADGTDTDGTSLSPGSYELRPGGLPELWSTAERADSVLVPSGRGRLVVPE